MADLAALQHEKSVLEREHALLVASIHELRERARKVSIEASVTRRHVEDSEKTFWRDGIAKLQGELLEVQAKIAVANKALRRAKANQPLKTLSQLPRNIAVKEEPPASIKPNGAAIQAPGDIKEGYALFLQFFRQLVVENIDPRLVEVFEKDAHSLVNDYRRMHKEPS